MCRDRDGWEPLKAEEDADRYMCLSHLDGRGLGFRVWGLGRGGTLNPKPWTQNFPKTLEPSNLKP